MAAVSLGGGKVGSEIERSALDPGAAWRNIDWILVVASIATAVLGAAMVYSATRFKSDTITDDQYFLNRQAIFITIGVLVMCAVAAIDYRLLRRVATAAYVANLAVLLLVVSPLGASALGAQARFDLPGGIQVQPSELTKIAVILMLASWCGTERSDGSQEEIELRRLIIALMLALTPIALIMLQPDLGTSLVFVSITAAILVIGGTKARLLVLLVVLTVGGGAGVIRGGFLDKYQKDRLTVFIDPKSVDSSRAGYNLNQSKIAIGSGGLTGKGLYEGTQTKLHYVPEQRTDFIFTVIGEELGFAGSGLLLGLFGVIIWRCWKAAGQANDRYGTLICAGVLAMLMFQIFENAGMTMGIMPVTGITLPFVSYGGSSVIACFAAVGLVLNVRMRRYS